MTQGWQGTRTCSVAERSVCDGNGRELPQRVQQFSETIPGYDDWVPTMRSRCAIKTAFVNFGTSARRPA